MKRFGMSTILSVWLLLTFIIAGRAEAQKPSLDAEAYFNRGLNCSRKGQYDKAISDFNKAIQINPNHATAYVSRGNVRRGRPPPP